MKLALRSILIVFTLFSAISWAVTPQQMSAFKSLPKAQQLALAKRMGVDLNSISGESSSNVGDEIDYSSQIKNQDLVDGEISDLDDKFEPQVESLGIFGSEIFNNPESVLLSKNLSSIPSDYILSIGDVLSVSLFGKESDTFEVTINSNGQVLLQGISPVPVLGLSFNEASKLISEKIALHKIGTDVSVSMSSVQPVNIFVAGEVNHPGTFVLPPFSNVTSALSFAGGVTEIASLRNVQVKRNNETVKTFDLYDLLLKGDRSSDITLKSGDVVFIPASDSIVSIFGAVKRPAKYEILSNESLSDAIKYAGGFSADAFKKQIRLLRSSGAATKSFKDIAATQFDSFSLTDGDQLYIDAKTSSISNSVTLLGAVSRPGVYEWTESSTLMSLIGDPKSSLLPIADFDYGLIVRDVDFNQSIELIQFSPNESYKASRQIKLLPNDKIVIFSRFELEKDERNLLKTYAVSETQFKLNQNVYEWGKYKQRSFNEFIASVEVNSDGVAISKKDNDLEFDTELSSERPIYNKELFEALEAKATELPELAFFSRSAMLPKILKRLETQSINGQAAQIAEISGKVKYPGLYPIAKGARLTDLIAAAGGLIEGAYLEQAELSRLKYNESMSVNNITIDLSAAMAGDMDKNLALVGRDYVNIFQIPDWHDNLTVELKGEVLLPGKYTIRKGESLKSVIQRAGGFGDFADLNAMVFTRKSLRLQEKIQLDQLADSLKKELITNNLNSQNSVLGSSTAGLDNLIGKLSDTKPVGRLVVDLDRVMNDEINLILEDEDTIHIPSKKQSLNVIGEVFVSTSHLYDKKLSVEDYISLSGGMKDKAASDKIFIVKASGQVFIPNRKSWFAVNESNLELAPGDTIVVPLDSQYTDNLTLWTQATQIVYQLGVAVAAIGSL